MPSSRRLRRLRVEAPAGGTNIGPAVRHRILPGRLSGSFLRAGAKGLTATLLAGALAGLLAGCSTSPPAAIVNGEVITQAQLDAQLQAWASSPAYVQSFNAQMLERAEELEQQGETDVQAYTVRGDGSGPGVYGIVWAGVVELSNMITAVAVREYLDSHKEAPSAVQVAAAWASEDASNPTLWEQLPPEARTTAAQEDANNALASGKPTNSATDEKFYKAQEVYYWSQVCLTVVDASVSAPGGGIDLSASKKEAEELVSQLSGHPGASGARVTSGARYCLSPEQLIEQQAAFRQQVGALAPGMATAIRQSYGYEVVQVRARTTIPYSQEIAEDVEILAVHGGSQAPAAEPAVIAILKAAKVEVNPTYGSWVSVVPAGDVPEVVPPGSS